MKTMGSLSLRNHFGAGGVVILMWTKMEPAGISLTNLDARSTEVLSPKRKGRESEKERCTNTEATGHGERLDPDQIRAP